MMRFATPSALALVAGLTLATAMTAPNAHAQNLPDDLVRLDILDGGETRDGTVLGAVRVTLSDGWKTYWRTPGDAGIPPSFSWQGSQNVANVEITWPAPEVFLTSGYQTLGYHDQMILPVEITPLRAGEPVTLKGRVWIGICREVCVPSQLNFDHTLDTSAKRNPAIVAALASRPFSAREGGVKSATCRLAPTEYGMKVTANITMPSAGGTEIAVIEPGSPYLQAGNTQARREGRVLVAETEFYSVDDSLVAVDRSAVRITVLGNSHAVDIQGCTTG
ncbi:protein-disulfide reductase DsbD domain-containing protein [Epibacterium ulvae]|uniref:protein-disulfide reductase DsbD domain-containing protein n=1 Tax=Epibacterium ulvae TaxID=1156985 RepID=UPI003EB9942B